MTILTKKNLARLYLKQGCSTQKIADIHKCSVNRIRYWMQKYCIKTRNISEAIYKKNNPKGDPFKIKYPNTLKEAKLFGIGLGLYWGEGTKADKGTVRLGNTDFDLLKKFIEFLIKFFGIKKENLKFSLQIFNDINEKEALKFWIEKLGVTKKQFYKTTISRSIRKGTYSKKSVYGVLTVYYHNKKMREALIEILQKNK